MFVLFVLDSAVRLQNRNCNCEIKAAFVIPKLSAILQNLSNKITGKVRVNVIKKCGFSFSLI